MTTRTSTIIVVATRQTARTRAKDSDRTDTCQVLDSALADGQLSMEEHRQRVASATNAATLGDLQSLVDDLQTENAPVQMPNLQEAAAARAAGRGGGWGIRAGRRRRARACSASAIGWGLYGNTAVAAELHLRSRRQGRRHPAEGAHAAARSCSPWAD